MKLKYNLLLLSLLVTLTATSQNSAVYRFFNKGIDAIVAQSNEIDSDYEEEKSNHVYSRMFSTPVLYSSVINKACAGDDSEGCSDSEMLAMDEKRTAVIDKLLLNMYSTNPEKIVMTEEELQQEMVLSGITADEKPALEMANASLSEQNAQLAASNKKLKKEITEAHEAASSAHKRIDGLETRINRME